MIWWVDDRSSTGEIVQRLFFPSSKLSKSDITFGLLPSIFLHIAFFGTLAQSVLEPPSLPRLWSLDHLLTCGATFVLDFQHLISPSIACKILLTFSAVLGLYLLRFYFDGV